MSANPSSCDLPKCININSDVIAYKDEMVNSFNQHFFSSGTSSIHGISNIQVSVPVDNSHFDEYLGD